MATGVVAIGQSATGVIAIGQIARGGFTIGQLAIGLAGIGQGSLQAFWGVGMVGASGIGGAGLLYPVMIPARPKHAEKGFWLPVRLVGLLLLVAAVAAFGTLPVARDLLSDPGGILRS